MHFNACISAAARYCVDLLQHRDPITRYHLAEARHTTAFETVVRSEFAQATYLARLECRRNEAWMPIATTGLSVIFVQDRQIMTKRVDVAAELGHNIEYMTPFIDSARSVFHVDGNRGGNRGVQFRNVYYYIDRYFAISAIGDVYIWDAYGYQSVHSAPAVRLGGVAVRSVAMGNRSYVLLVTHTGHVFSWREEAPSSLKRIHIEGESRSASCGENHSLVVMEGGTVYTFGSQHGLDRYAEFPEKIVMSPIGAMRIASTATGSVHSLAVTEDGRVLSWGRDLGQLGRPRKGRKHDHNHLIGFIPDIGRVRSVAACDHTSCAVTIDGKLFVWGKTQFRTSGRVHFSRAPLLVDALCDHVVDSVSMFFGHVVVLTRDGRVIGMDLTSALSPARRMKQYTTIAL